MSGVSSRLVRAALRRTPGRYRIESLSNRLLRPSHLARRHSRRGSPVHRLLDTRISLPSEHHLIGLGGTGVARDTVEVEEPAGRLAFVQGPQQRVPDEFRRSLLDPAAGIRVGPATQRDPVGPHLAGIWLRQHRDRSLHRERRDHDKIRLGRAAQRRHAQLHMARRKDAGPSRELIRTDPPALLGRGEPARGQPERIILRRRRQHHGHPGLGLDFEGQERLAQQPAFLSRQQCQRLCRLELCQSDSRPLRRQPLADGRHGIVNGRHLECVCPRPVGPDQQGRHQQDCLPETEREVMHGVKATKLHGHMPVAKPTGALICERGQ
jgi:hypothetical protein